MKSKRPQTMRGETYLEKSRTWAFRLYTGRELQLLLRLDRKTLIKICRNLEIIPLRRRVLSGPNEGQIGKRTFYTDTMVFKILNHLFTNFDGKL
jgi:hypothetical protein